MSGEFSCLTAKNEANKNIRQNVDFKLNIFKVVLYCVLIIFGSNIYIYWRNLQYKLYDILRLSAHRFPGGSGWEGIDRVGA
jgi:hypothetical protein